MFRSVIKATGCHCLHPSADSGSFARIIAAALIIALGAPGGPAYAADSKCTVAKILEAPVMMNGALPMVSVKLNDVDVRLTVETGSTFGLISRASAEQLKLPVSTTPYGYDSVQGIGGTSRSMIADIKDFRIAGLTLHKIQILVGGNDERERGTMGDLGRNVLAMGDTEYDFSQGVMRILQPRGCEDTMLAYWVKPSEHYSVVDLPSTRHGSGIWGIAYHLRAFEMPVYVNGTKLRVMLGSGSEVSLLSRKSAEQAGIDIHAPGVVEAGFSGGLGLEEFKTWIVPVSSVKIGDEEIRNTSIKVTDADLSEALGEDMVLGADFFLSHHILVANSQNKIYFTYSGGPVFNVTGDKFAKAAGHPPGTNAGTTLERPAESASGLEDPAAHASKGAALAARHNFEQAVAELSRAHDLAPDNAEYVLRRAQLYLQINQTESALKDMDQAIALKPNDVDIRMADAELSIHRHDRARAIADLDVARRIVQKEDNVHFQLGLDYEQLNEWSAALREYDEWLDVHWADVKIPAVRTARCRVRVFEGGDLSAAKKDCDAALSLATAGSPQYSDASRARALLYLRRGEYRKSLSDYEESLSIEPSNAWALYGKGIDELRTKQTTQGEADIRQATAISPTIADEFDQRGISVR